MWGILEKRVWQCEHQICSYAKTDKGHGPEAGNEDDTDRIVRLERDLKSIFLKIDYSMVNKESLDDILAEYTKQVGSIQKQVDGFATQGEVAILKVTTDEKIEQLKQLIKENEGAGGVDSKGEKTEGEGGGGMTIMMPVPQCAPMMPMCQPMAQPAPQMMQCVPQPVAQPTMVCQPQEQMQTQMMCQPMPTQ